MDFNLVFYPSENIIYTNDNSDEQDRENAIIESIKYNKFILNQSDIVLFIYYYYIVLQNRIKSGWFNDTVVDFFTKYFLDQLNKECSSTIHTFGASFYEVLKNTDYKPTKTFFDVTKINTIIFPICTSSHFSLAIFHNLLTVYQAVKGEEEGDDNNSMPAIICLDPLRIHSTNQIAENLRTFYVNILNTYFSTNPISEIFSRLVLPRVYII